MPSFYSNTTSQQGPLTPPYQHETFLARDRGSYHLPSLRLVGAQAPFHTSGRSEVRDYTSHYPQYSRASYPQENTRQTVPSQSFSNHSNSASAPMLPPIRIPERLHMDDFPKQLQSIRAPVVPQPKEEKAVGGVAAHLDYEMEDMVDFVSETAQGMYDIYASKICLADIDMARSVLSSKVIVRPDFRKYVSQVLSSTRLPSSTIILGLYYLAKRMTLLSINGTFNHGGGQVYRLLTIGLLLGSKFLDDNTFQNRSWSEVSNIPVSELNTMEVEWLAAIRWNMHINPEDPQGFLLWRQQWQTFLNGRANAMVDQSLLQSLKQTTLNSDIRRQTSVTQRSSPLSGIPPPFADHSVSNAFKASLQTQWAAPRYDPWQSARSHTEYSPPSAPETGPPTPGPDWYGSHIMSSYGQTQQQAYPTLKIPPPLQVVGSNASHTGYSTPYSHQSYSTYAHGNTCGCSHCMPYHDCWRMAPGFGPQSAVG
ncbi:hypothetical protein P7C71_g435, partial [Lecanoromycetidae sp. Uapishka_2]